MYTSEIIKAILARDAEERKIPTERVITAAIVEKRGDYGWVADFEYADNHVEMYWTDKNTNSIKHRVIAAA